MNKLNKSDMVIYDDGELELNVSVNDETKRESASKRK